MSDAQTQVITDPLGRPYDVAPQATIDPAMLPGGEFSPEQAALANVNMPFRKIIRDPFLCAVGEQAVTTPIDRALLISKRVTSFHVVNPNPFYCRLRGATGEPSDNIVDNEGWLWPPGFVGVYSTQYPAFVSCIAVERPGFPLRDDEGALLPFYPLELAYGIGGA